MSERLHHASIVTRRPENAALAMKGEYPIVPGHQYVSAMHFDSAGLTGLFALPDNLQALWAAKERQQNKPFTTVTTVDCAEAALQRPEISSEVSAKVQQLIGDMIRQAEADPKHILNTRPFGFLLPANTEVTPDGFYGTVKVGGVDRPTVGLMFAPVYDAPFIQVHAHLKHDNPFYAGTSANIAGKGGGSGHSEMGHTMIDFGGRQLCFFLAEDPGNPDPAFRPNGQDTRSAQSTTMVYVDNDGHTSLVRLGSTGLQETSVALETAGFASFSAESGKYAVANPYDYRSLTLGQKMVMWSFARAAYVHAGDEDWMLTPEIHSAWSRAFHHLGHSHEQIKHTAIMKDAA